VSLAEHLARIPDFQALSGEHLEELAQHAAMIELASGDILFLEGSEPTEVFYVIDGNFEVTHDTPDGEVVFGTVSAGEVIGELSLIRGTTRGGTVRATTPAQLVCLPAQAFLDLLANQQTARMMMETVIKRLRERETALQRSERLASLGTFAAGILHEVNNPAAAVENIAGRLVEMVQRLESIFENRYGPKPTTAVAGLELAERIDEIAGTLDRLGVEQPWELAESLAATGYRTEEVGRIAAADVADLALLAELRLFETLVGELSVAATRIREVTGAVKSFTYVDQGVVQTVDVHADIDKTLLVLKAKLADIDVVRNYQPELPAVQGSGAELNQVWSNLIDNAADAMEGKGRLTISTRSEPGRVVVEFADTGPGIPVETGDRLFEAYYTTKAPGSGTGLGLYLSHRIVLQHRGRVAYTSSETGTTFTVSLPTEDETKTKAAR